MLLEDPNNAPKKGMFGIDRYMTARWGELYMVRPRPEAGLARKKALVVLVTVWKVRRSVGKVGKRMSSGLYAYLTESIWKMSDA